jgi:hypothetical protein
LFILLQLLSVFHWVLQSWIGIFVYCTSTFPLVPPWTLLGYSQGNECITNTGTVSIASGIQVVIGNILCECTMSLEACEKLRNMFDNIACEPPIKTWDCCWECCENAK